MKKIPLIWISSALAGIVTATLVFSLLLNYFLLTQQIVRPEWLQDYVTSADEKSKFTTTH